VNRDDIIRIAEEAEMIRMDGMGVYYHAVDVRNLKHFAALVAAAIRARRDK
jgi:hypothetical protein